MIRRAFTALAALAFVALTIAPAAADLLKITSFSPGSGPPGSSVVINGGGMQRVNSVKFNGVAASFTVNSAKKVTATVPAGASTGKIAIARPGSTVSTATDFTVTIPPTVTPWSSFQHDAKHTGKSAAAGPSASQVHAAWVYKAVNWIKNEPSIGPDGTVYIGDSKFPLCALDPASGTLKWCTDVGGYVNQSSPAIGNPFNKTDAQGTRTVQTIYMGERNNVFWAIDSEGDVLWSYKINLDGDVRQSPIIGPPPSNTVYMMCGCTTRGVLHAFTPDGTLKWFVNLPSVRDASPAAIERNGVFRLYVITNNGVLHAIDDVGPSGQIAWTLSLGSNSDHSSPSIGPDGTIYVGTDKGVYAVQDNGGSAQVRPGWPFLTSGGVDTTPSISNGRLFVSSFKSGTRTLYAIDATTSPPTQVWSKSGPGSTSSNFAQTPSAVIGGDGIVYAAIGEDVYAFNPTSSTPRWQYSLPADAISLTLGNGVLYVSARNSRLYALVDGP
jgi:outer membrane protein assembly factor BamB